MFRVFTNYHNFTFAFDDFALIAHGFYRRTHLHNNTSFGLSSLIRYEIQALDFFPRQIILP